MLSGEQCCFGQQYRGATPELLTARPKVCKTAKQYAESARHIWQVQRITRLICQQETKDLVRLHVMAGQSC